ncbi:MAG: prolipoprotein diacylglyceryl transferase family protein [Patescibacteria group bacterium]
MFILDSHNHLANWGLIPEMVIGPIRISVYSLFVTISLFVGIITYILILRKYHKVNDSNFALIFGAITGGILGAKIVGLLKHFFLVTSTNIIFTFLTSDKSIVGGILGGMIGIYIVKRLLKIEGRKGNYIAPAVCLSMAVGRIGCFVAGCCYGVETSLPWGVDFGDNKLRHPTQIYEAIFDMVLFTLLLKLLGKKPKDGQLFDLFLTSYFVFRFFLEFIKYENYKILELTIYQIISILVIVKMMWKYRTEITLRFNKLNFSKKYN